MHEYREFTMKRIVVATDFSDASYGAVNYARQLARCFAARVLVVHVIDMARTLQLDGMPTEPLPSRIDSAEDELQRIGSSLSFDGIPCSTAVRVGTIREMVSELIDERHADLLVIGTSGKGFRDGEGLGSVAEMLLRSVSCPVLTVGKSVRLDAYEATHERVILFPTDFSEVSRAALAYTACLARHLAGRLVLLHIVRADSRVPASVHERQFQEFTREITYPVISECLVRAGNTADTIVKVSAEKRTDFIVMGVHGRHEAEIALGEKFAFDVIRLARCPVFTLSAGDKGHALDHVLAGTARA